MTSGFSVIGFIPGGIVTHDVVRPYTHAETEYAADIVGPMVEVSRHRAGPFCGIS